MRRKAFFILLLPALFLVNLHAQGISGVVNSYYAITDVFPGYIQADLGEDLGSLQPGDKVVLMQMSGVLVNSGSGFENSDQSYADLLNAGRYEMLSVKSVNNISKRVEFTVTLDETKFTDGEKLQLVKIYEADYATVEAGLTAMPWDGTKGGVLALVVFKKLTFDADIELSGSGFRGAETAPIYTAGCSNSTVYYFPGISPDSAGRKGEGPILNSWTHYVGPGKVVTGGGGGIGEYAGGGGGGHFGPGGAGGDQRASCNIQWAASGGLALNEGNFYSSNRVTMGGGGGASTESASNDATAGGDGGGIVIILADTLEANSHTIHNNGMNVSTTAQAGGGGGGAGGSILLDVNVYTNALNLSVEGGIGGSTGSLQTGAGGGGGGGIIWHAGSSLSPNISSSIYGANGGNPQTPDVDLDGGNGSVGGIVDELELPLHGFLFNSLVGVDTICENQRPNTITGSMPKGGQAAYVYSWLQSTDEISWSAALGTGDSLNFLPDTLTETTYFKRLIVSGDVSDTSLSIEIFVYDAIAGYAIALRDTLCSGESPGVLSGGSLSGGNGSYSYQWQSTINQPGWTNRVTTSVLNEGTLTQTTFYRRFVYSAEVCTATSNIDTISIIPVIMNNTILSGDTAICESLDGGTILAETPSGGDGIYSYQWQQSDDDLSYSDIPGATAINYSKGVLTASKYYQRIVYSGADDACVSVTTEPHFITVYPSLNSNSISTDSSLYCEGDVAEIFNGLIATGGEAGNYAYSWLQQLPGQNWDLIAGETTASYIPSTALNDSVLIRRVVISGQYSACIDSSNIIDVDVIPTIINNLTSANEAICEAGIPITFSESPASGGVGGYAYLWELQEEGSSTWSLALEDISPNDQASYSSPALEITTLYRRTVQSNICIDNSNSITITVFPFIENNTISGGDIQYNCFNSAITLNSPIPDGGDQSNMIYAWQEADDGAVWSSAGGANTTQNYTSAELGDSIYFRRLVESGPAAQCKDTSKVVLIRINSLPTGDIVSSIDTLCSGDAIAISYENLTGNGPWSIGIGETSNLHTESGITTPSGEFNISLDESYRLRILELSDDSACLANLSGNSGRVNAISFEVPIANAGVDIEACELQTTLAAVPSVGDGLWSGSGMLFANSSSPTTSVTSGNYGMNMLTWTETNWECESSHDVEVTFYETPSDANAGEDQTLDNFYSTTISATEPSAGTGAWSIPEGNGSIADPNLANTVVGFEGPGTYTLLWAISNGVCEAATDSVKISVGELKQYTGFSPNSDGVNDFFTLRFPGNTTVELLIYDQWGGLIYGVSEENAVEVSWDGTYDGGYASEGTYFYIVKENGSVKRSYLELRR